MFQTSECSLQFSLTKEEKESCRFFDYSQSDLAFSVSDAGVRLCVHPCVVCNVQATVRRASSRVLTMHVLTRL